MTKVDRKLIYHCYFSQAGEDRKNEELPPIIAQILVRKCKNGMCSSLKLTCNIKHINLRSNALLL